MPGKVNPSIAEMVNMVCYQALGNDVTIAAAAEAGQLELNVMMPVIAHNLLFTMQILTNASLVFARSEEHTSELQSQSNLVCRLLLEKKKKTQTTIQSDTYCNRYTRT